MSDRICILEWSKLIDVLQNDQKQHGRNLTWILQSFQAWAISRKSLLLRFLLGNSCFAFLARDMEFLIATSILRAKNLEQSFKKTHSWQFCDRDLFGDGENVTLSKLVGDLQLGDKKVTNWITWLLLFVCFSTCHQTHTVLHLDIALDVTWDRHGKIPRVARP